MIRKKNVFIHQLIVPEYRVSIFNALLKKFDNCYFIYGEPKSGSSLINGQIPENNKYIKVTNFFLPTRKSIFLSNIFVPIFRYRPGIIITQYSPGNLVIFILYLLRPFLKFKLIGWYHGWDRRKIYSPNKTINDKLRFYMLGKADAIILYSEDAKKVLSNYMNPSKIFVANNTLDTANLERLRKKFVTMGKDKIKKELGFQSKYNIVYSGRLEPEKKTKELLRIFKILRSNFIDISLHIIGNGPLENELKHFVENENIKHVNFYGGIYDEVLTGKMIYCSDLMIIPSWVGLSIVHSFCFECPVMTFEELYHPPEIIYLVHGKTGFVLGRHSDVEIVEVIIEYLSNESKQKQFKMNVLKMIEDHASIDKMVQGVSDAINCFS